MVPAPTAATMTLCEVALVEKGTDRLTSVGRFSKLSFREFPAKSDPFHIVAVLVGGNGEGRLELVLTSLATGEDLFTHRTTINFSDRFAEVSFSLRVQNCRFGRPGAFQFTLFVDGEWVAQQRLDIIPREDQA